MNDNAPYRRLWSAVVHQAVHDLDGGAANAALARDWIYGGRRDAGSMFWVCDMLDLDYNKLLTLCMTREGRRKILRPNFRFTGTRDATEIT
jgi:hypothetical protein